METIALYTYCKSSAAYRVRIALQLKNIGYEPVYISLIKDGGENYSPEYMQINPQAMVPVLQVGTTVVTQSTAIIEFLEQRYPDPSLLPKDEIARARARAYSQMIACDIHPLNNLRVLHYLESKLNATEEDKLSWYQHWIYEGFNALETSLTNDENGNHYCVGDSPTIADIYLVPQVYNAHRYQCNMTDYPNINRINENCLKLPAFKNAAPENQEDFSIQVT